MFKYEFAIRLQKNQYFPVTLSRTARVKHGQFIVVRTEKGEEVAKLVKIPEPVIEQWKENLPEPVPMVRTVTQKDLDNLKDRDEKERQAFVKCLELVDKHELPMRLVTSSYTFDKKRLTFYFTANGRVDFRDLLKNLTQTFRRTRIDLRHIGVRDETSLIDGYGLCGRQFCCSSWLKKFNSVNIRLAKDQGLPINPTKISGTCGRLMCCLNYEYPIYLEAAVGMPPVGSGVMTPEGIGRVCALHFLNSTAVVKLEDGRVSEFKKHEIEMLDEDVTGINIDISDYTQEQTDEDIQIDLSELEDKDDEYT
ncbi:MAG: regulatory iron-sulfur-containing complex subunit RicT [Cyanobacteriota bacterium]